MLLVGYAVLTIDRSAILRRAGIGDYLFSKRSCRSVSRVKYGYQLSGRIGEGYIILRPIGA